MTSSPTPTDMRSLSRARLAVSACFFVFGIFICSWAPHIPLAKERLALSSGWFGTALLCMGLGGILAMPLCGWFVNRFGSAPVLTACALLSAASLPLLVIAPTFWTFSAALLLFGALTGMTDVAMNSHGLAVEQQARRAYMSTFHGLFSVAGLVTAVIASILIERISELNRMLLSTFVCIGIILIASRFLLPANVDRGKSDRPLALPTKATVGLGLLCMLALMIEGSVVDWAGIYLRETHQAGIGLTSLMVAAYFGMMAVSRLTGDALRMRFGAARLVAASGSLTAVFLTLALISPTAPMALIAFAMSGLTIGPIAPVLFAGGGRAEPDHPGRGVAAVVTLGYFGIITGPPLVGFLAEATSLPVSFAAMAAGAAAIWYFAAATSAADGKLNSKSKA